MTEVKKNFYMKFIKPHLDIVMFFTLVSMGVTFYLKSETKTIEDAAKIREIEQKIYPDALTLQKAMDHDNEVPSDVENFKREIHLIKTGDTLKIRQKEIQAQIKVIDSFYDFSKKKAKNDSITDILKQKSRDKRTEDIEQMKREQQNIGNTLQMIQRTLDTLK